MEQIMNVVNFFKSHSVELFAVAGAVYTIALFIVNLTPTPKDNEALSRVYKIVHTVIGKLGIKK